MTAPGPGSSPPSNGADPETLVGAALSRLEAVTTLSALDELQTELLGKRSDLARAHQGLVTLEPGDRPEAGRKLNEARRRIESHLADKRGDLERSERAVRLAADRLDLTEVTEAPWRGRLHVVAADP